MIDFFVCLFVPKKKRRTTSELLAANDKFCVKSCGTLGIMFHARNICKSSSLSKKLKKSQLFENLNDAYIISMPVFAACK